MAAQLTDWKETSAFTQLSPDFGLFSNGLSLFSLRWEAESQSVEPFHRAEWSDCRESAGVDRKWEIMVRDMSRIQLGGRSKTIGGQPWGPGWNGRRTKQRPLKSCQQKTEWQNTGGGGERGVFRVARYVLFEQQPNYLLKTDKPHHYGISYSSTSETLNYSKGRVHS